MRRHGYRLSILVFEGHCYAWKYESSPLYIFILIIPLFFAAQLYTFVRAMCNQILYHFELNIPSGLVH